jgi:hypothetical protein
MRKLFLVLVLMVIVMGDAAAQDTKRIVVPGNAGIDVEQLKDNIDLNMDVSKLSLYEIRVLKAAMEARQGKCIMESELRGLFDQTSWYLELAIKNNSYAWSDKENALVPVVTPKISYTPQEQEFLDKLNKAEMELQQNNIMLLGTKSKPQWGPNIDNLANPMQVSDMPKPLRDALTRSGFAIVPEQQEQLFHVYENNDYHAFPSFVTTDLHLQAFHMYFDFMLRKMEEGKMLKVMTDYTKALYTEMMAKAKTSKGNMRAAAQRDAAYFAIAHSLLSGKKLMPLPAKYATMAQQEIKHVKAAQNDYSKFLDYNDVKFGYDIYRPRGHYTRSNALKRYFMGMMWLQNAPFGSDKPEQLRAALLIANTIGSSAAHTKTYKTIDGPITYLMGNSDNLSMLNIYDIMKADGAPINKYMTSNDDLNRVCKAIEKKDEEVTRIRPKYERTSHCKINLMPQRYMPDGEVLQEMVDYDSEPTKRDAPKGLDIFAAMGVNSAMRILVDELKENQKWDGYTTNMNRMKARMNEIDWNSTVSNKWMDALKALNEKPQNMPYFMKNEQWDKKSLNAALASWAELKHDAILYAKQPMGAECGGGEDLPNPHVMGYVEPNVAYWTKAIGLLDATSKVLNDFGMMTADMSNVTTQLKEQTQFLLNASKKELNGQLLNGEELDQIKGIGSKFEYITLQIVGAEPGASWDMSVSGADKSIAVIADVYTANADNNPQKSVLYEAVGPAHEIYVVVEVGGYLYLTRGAVFSYREFKEDIAAPRTTDEEWQQDLKKQPNKGIPSWMEEIIVPIDNKPLDNEHFFYSTGC